MPYTLSHIAAIIPINKKPLILSALIIGCIVPDTLYFIPFIPNYTFTHTLLGLFIFCLPISILLFYFYHIILKQPCLSLIGKKIETTSNKHLLHFNHLLIISILLGALTHITWDSFTHSHGYMVQNIKLLQNNSIFDLPTYKLLQYLSTIFGGLIVLIWIIKQNWFHLNNKAKLKHIIIKSYKIFIVLCIIATFAILLNLHILIHSGFKAFVVKTLILTMSNIMLISIIYAIYWHFTQKKPLH